MSPSASNPAGYYPPPPAYPPAAPSAYYASYPAQSPGQPAPASAYEYNPVPGGGTPAYAAQNYYAQNEYSHSPYHAAEPAPSTSPQIYSPYQQGPYPPPPPAVPAPAHPAQSTPAHTPSVKIRFRAPPLPVDSTEMGAGRVSRRTSMNHQEEPAMSVSGRPQRGSTRLAAQTSIYKEDEEEDEFEDAVGEPDEDEEDESDAEFMAAGPTTTRSGRARKPPVRYEEELEMQRTATPEETSTSRSTKGKSNRRIIMDMDDEEEEGPPPPRNAFPARATRNSFAAADAVADQDPSSSGRALRSSNRQTSRPRHSSADAEEFEPTDEDEETHSDHASSDELGNYGEEDDFIVDDDGAGYGKRRTTRRATRATRSTRSSAAPTRRSTRSAAKVRIADTDEDSPHKRPNLRARTSKPNYHIPTIDEISKEISMQEAIAAVSRPNGRAGGLRGMGGGMRFNGAALPFGLRGKNFTQAMGDPDTSDSDDLDFASPMKGGASSMPSGGAAATRGTAGPSDVPNFGRINPKSSTADADPLGVDMNVTFDNVGGLDNHINQLKEMVALPLLYPEVFQQFGITPPRGVLFHGPPGTGKTLLARALAASCSTGNTKISFFMRKGADVLSKWVGEAERQLRMLFEEARASQPSIIFFDEIDGLAPVRSSKQDQIHASLVSTLLALMDGMDGRGQVIVIGATNRPDAVDPALRRPGRFDREFYFPLPNREARKKIISINTRAWEPLLADPVLDQLATLTKGYGGADLRALCTEAALNAIQRRYPQIYKTADRLELQTKSIKVQAKDFMMSIKKIVPSSARSAASPAIQLPPHLAPLLLAPLNRLKHAVDHVLPPKKRATALEEAEFEEEDSDGFEKHMMLQSLDKLRTFRPRILVHGEPGMGQTYLGPAVLHHLEGFHVQSLDLGTLLSDSTRSIEAAIVQLFIEVKRHQPSVIFIPSLSQWATSVPDIARSTFGALLNGIPPSDPILLLGMVDGPAIDLPGDVRAWFGFAPENRIELDLPTASERSAYFVDLVFTIRKPPTEFPDGIPRRKRVLEVLPLAAPLPPRQATEAELAREEEKDQAARNMMVVSFTNLVQEFMKRYRKVVGSVKDDALELSQYLSEQAAAPTVPTEDAMPAAEDAEGDVAGHDEISQVNGDGVDLDGARTEAGEAAIPTHASAPVAVLSAPTAVPTCTWKAHDVDIDTLQRKLIRHKYFTPDDFLADVRKIEENAAKLGDPERQAKVVEMSANARLHVSGFDQKWTPEFERYSERMKARKAERQNRKEQQEKEKAIAEQEEAAKVAAEGEANGTEPTLAERVGAKRDREEETGEGDSQGREKRPREDGPVPMDNPAVPDVDSEPAVPAPRSRSLTPATVYPPFVVPESGMSDLQSELEAETSQLSVDQLEQLRATLFDRLWNDRTRWDRTETVDRMRKSLKDYVKEVESWREGGGWGLQ